MTERSLEEVGAIVAARRIALTMNPADLVKAAGIDSKTLRSLEEGIRWPQDKNRAKIEEHLRWTPGSIAAIRAGKDPTEVPEAEAVEDPAPDQPPMLLAGELLWSRMKAVAESVAPLDDQPQLRQAVKQLLTVVVDVVGDFMMQVGPPAKSVVEDIYTNVGRLNEGLSRDGEYSEVVGDVNDFRDAVPPPNDVLKDSGDTPGLRDIPDPGRDGGEGGPNPRIEAG